MAFRSEKQRKGFFANLKNKYHNTMEKKHNDLKIKLIKQAKQEEIKLKQNQKDYNEIKQINKSKQKIQDLKNAQRKIKEEKFKSSHLGKFTQKAKRGISHAINYEKKHGKSQLTKLKKLLK